MMEELQDIVGGSKSNKIKKYLPYIIGGVVLGGIGYLYSKNSNSNSVTQDPTSGIGAIGGGGGDSVTSTGGTSSIGQNEVVSFFTEALNQTYKQTQVDSQNLATEFRNNDATLSKQLTDLTNEIQNNIVSSSGAVAVQPIPQSNPVSTPINTISTPIYTPTPSYTPTEKTLDQQLATKQQVIDVATANNGNTNFIQTYQEKANDLKGQIEYGTSITPPTPSKDLQQQLATKQQALDTAIKNGGSAKFIEKYQNQVNDLKGKIEFGG